MKKKKITREDLEFRDNPYNEVVKYAHPTLFVPELSRSQKILIGKWIRALREGKYKQCQHMMTTGKAYDALGVGCLVSGIRPKKTGSRWTFLGAGGYLPEKVVEKLGLADEEGGSKYFRLNVLNDSGWTFEQIATIIEKSLELHRKTSK